jgi:signal transduction histidine kinase
LEIKNKILNEFFKIILFGFSSYILGLIRFSIPGLESTTSDFREIPLLISIFHVSNPISLIIMSLITSLDFITQHTFTQTFISHAFALTVSWYIFKFIKTKKRSYYISGFIWLSYVTIYYFIFLVPAIIISYEISDIYIDTPFWLSFQKFIFSLRFEIIATSLITSLYLIQLKIRKELIKQKDYLETAVRERTDELESANEELVSINEELISANETMSDKNEIINKQNIDLQNTLNNLKEAQIQLLHAEKMASLGTLTAGVAHEINNPLNFILGSYHALEEYFKNYGSQDTKKTTFLLESIKTGIERTSEIVKGLNQFSRSNKTLDEDCELQPIIENCLVMLNNPFRHRINIIKNYDPEINYIKGNIGKLHQVFMNIIFNAIQAIDDEGEIIITTKKINTNVHIEISDNGCGIDKNNLPKIADPFFTTKDSGKGIGLGLSISYSIIKEHKGEISFESELNKGTKVLIVIPVNLNYDPKN